MTVGLVCAVVTWPWVYLTKLLFTRKMIDQTIEPIWKQYFTRQKGFTDTIGLIVVFAMICIAVIGISVVSVYYPYTPD
jgi:hypothetical protein